MFPTNPYYEFTSPLAPPIVAGGAAATVTTSQMPGVSIITAPLGALYDTTTNPLVINPAIEGMIVQVKNLEVGTIRVTSGAAADSGIVVPSGSTSTITMSGGVLSLISSSAGNLGYGAPFTALAVVTAALPAYTRVGGTITANAVGAPGAVFDGVTPVAGSTVLLQEGIAAAAIDGGPWVITQMGTAGLALIMVRPSWWSNGAVTPEGSKITIQEGTVFKNTRWTTWVAGAGIVIGTGAPLLFPDQVIVYRTLVGGTLAAAITSIPLRSATLSDVKVNRKDAAGAGIANTTGYYPTVAGANGLVAGQANPGTASIQVQATVAAGTINATDTSNVTITITNL